VFRARLATTCVVPWARCGGPYTDDAIDIVQQLSADDPVQITDRALARSFNHAIAEREIRSALIAGDINLAQSFVELARSSTLSIDAALADQVQKECRPPISSSSMRPRRKKPRKLRSERAPTRVPRWLQ
jgi:hypothetical protein